MRVHIPPTLTMNTNSSLVIGDATSPLLNCCSFSAVSGKKPLARLLISLILRKSLKISFEPLVKALTIVFSLFQAEGGCAGDDGCPGVVEPGGVWWTDTLDVIHLTGTSTRCEDTRAAVTVAGQRTRRRQCDGKNMCWRRAEELNVKLNWNPSSRVKNGGRRER